MELFIDPDDNRSAVRQLYDQIRDAITDGGLSPGDRLLPTRAVAAELNVARSTVTDAYGRLTAEGYVEGRAGGGSIVAGAPGTPTEPSPPAALVPTRRAASLRLFDADPQADAAVDLRAGRIDPSLFPAAAWRRCLLAALRRPVPQYGDPAGDAGLRAALARWVATSRGITVTPEQIVVTSGTTHAIDLVARVLLEPGAVVGVEDPGYPLVPELLRVHGIDAVGVPVDEYGIVVDAIPPAARLVCVTPSHQFPLGVVMNRRRRAELLRWAGRAGAAIVEDDYDSEFRHSPRPLEPLHRLDHDGRVIYVGTFSKTLSPGLRVGFLAAPPTLIPAVIAARQAVDWCPPPITQWALAQFIDDGHLGRHLRRARPVYTQRQRLLYRQLRHRLPAGYQVLPAHAGLHLAVLGADTPAEPDLHGRLAAHGIRLSSLRGTHLQLPPAAGFLTGFGALSTDQLSLAVDTLATCLDGAAEVVS